MRLWLHALPILPKMVGNDRQSLPCNKSFVTLQISTRAICRVTINLVLPEHKTKQQYTTFTNTAQKFVIPLA